MKKVEDDVIGLAAAQFWQWMYEGHTLGTWDDGICRSPGEVSDVPQCLTLCQQKRASEGAAWNGMTWRNDGECCCFKNDRQSRSNLAYTHYKLTGNFPTRMVTNQLEL